MTIWEKVISQSGSFTKFISGYVVRADGAKPINLHIPIGMSVVCLSVISFSNCRYCNSQVFHLGLVGLGEGVWSMHQPDYCEASFLVMD